MFYFVIIFSLVTNLVCLLFVYYADKKLQAVIKVVNNKDGKAPTTPLSAGTLNIKRAK